MRIDFERQIEEELTDVVMVPQQEEGQTHQLVDDEIETSVRENEEAEERDIMECMDEQIENAEWENSVGTERDNEETAEEQDIMSEEKDSNLSTFPSRVEHSSINLENAIEEEAMDVAKLPKQTEHQQQQLDYEDRKDQVVKHIRVAEKKTIEGARKIEEEIQFGVLSQACVKNELLWKYYIPRITKSEALCKVCNTFVFCKGGSTESLTNHLKYAHNITIVQTYHIEGKYEGVVEEEIVGYMSEKIDNAKNEKMEAVNLEKVEGTERENEETQDVGNKEGVNDMCAFPFEGEHTSIDSEHNIEGEAMGFAMFPEQQEHQKPMLDDKQGSDQVFKNNEQEKIQGTREIEGEIIFDLSNQAYLKSELLWKYYTPKIPNLEAVCKACNRIVLFRDGSTESLTNHLKHAHNIIIEQIYEELLRELNENDFKPSFIEINEFKPYLADTPESVGRSENEVGNVDTDTPPKIKCPWCDKMFAKDNDTFALHIKAEHLWGVFQCPSCKYKANFANDLIEHMERQGHVGNPLTGCPKCKSEFPLLEIGAHYEDCAPGKNIKCQ